MPFTLYDANLFVAYTTPTDQSLIAIRYLPLAAVFALRITLYDTNLFGANAPYPYKSLKALGGEGLWC